MAESVHTINGADKKTVYENLLKVAKRKTADADMKLNDQGKAIVEDEAEDFGENVLIVKPEVEESTETDAKPATVVAAVKINATVQIRPRLCRV